MASWTFSHLESGLVRLASDAGHILDMHPAALLQMTASELLAMLERRAAEVVEHHEASGAAEAAPVEASSDSGE
ncbi:MAG TPA: hypothetical protein VFN11_04425 [Ktedonobacterales bacterium]|nr:hypothetical protein [Ktedonobacterales bacterium]